MVYITSILSAKSRFALLQPFVKRILRKCGYPPDKQEKATLTVLEQAALLCKDWGSIEAMPT